MKQIILVQNQETDPNNAIIDPLLAFLSKKGIVLEVLKLTTKTGPLPHPTMEKPNLIMVLGGDGTFLLAARHFAKQGIPIVGINTGHLGFLTRIEAPKVHQYLEWILSKETAVEDRMTVMIDKNPDQLALNDVVVKHANPSRLAKMHVHIEDRLLATYDADGIIISTPTGSTAYNLSAGGPIMDPTAEALAITPICPHSLSAKPIVVPAHKTLRVTSDSSNVLPLVVALDGEETMEVLPGASFSLSRSPYSIPLVTFPLDKDDFYAILKRKLGWGNNPRALAKP